MVMEEFSVFVSINGPPNALFLLQVKGLDLLHLHEFVHPIRVVSLLLIR